MHKSSAVLSFLLLIFSFQPLAAHGTSFESRPGQIDVSTYWVVASGLTQNTGLTVDANLNVTSYVFSEGTTRNNAGVAGLDSMIEVTVLPGLAVGVIANIPQFILNGLQGGTYALTLAGTIDWKWYRSERLALNTRLEAEADPLFGVPDTSDRGFFNLFFTFIGASYEIARKDGSALVFYTDAKMITTFINSSWRSYESDFEMEFMLPLGSTSSLPHKVGPLNRFAISPGIEMQLGKFIFSLGFNVPIISIGPTGIIQNLLADIGWEDIELAWRYRM